MNRYFCFIVLMLILLSCDSSRLFETNYTFENKLWNIDTIPEFRFKIEDTQPKNVFINIRNSISYPYQNLYLSYTLTDDQGTELAQELVNLQLFDEKTGKPFGKGNSIYAHQTEILNNFTFPGTGDFQIKIAHYMREVDLSEILSVGLRVEEIN